MRRVRHEVAWLVETVTQLTAAAERSVSKVLERAWPSYVLILLLQGKIIWGIWGLRDITSGDTASYFQGALAWARVSS
jgi:TRAP-type mannitol/chloroaromatic compound transport system permease large subunit